jgi:hypothetical protein
MFERALTDARRREKRVAQHRGQENSVEIGCRLRRIETWTQKNDGLLLAKPAAENENKNFDLGPSGETSARMEN